MLKIVTFALIVVTISASIQTDWIIYMQKFNKTYTEDEGVQRRFIYESNMKLIQRQNELYAQGQSSFYAGENQFTDWTIEEFQRKMTCFNEEVDPKVLFESQEDISDLPKSVDWRDRGYVTDVKDQGNCGSCYTFSATGSLEGQHFAKTKKLISLSESNLVDCTNSFGNSGCFGGRMSHCFDYIKANGGIDTEKSYPYIPFEWSCQYKKRGNGATVRGYVNITRGSEIALQKAVAQVGPISVGIDGTLDSFKHYHGGIYNDSSCSTINLNHAILVVGYGTENGEDYWLVKNSWGKKWGVNGYGKIARNKNNRCGIASAALYPLV